MQSRHYTSVNQRSLLSSKNFSRSDYINRIRSCLSEYSKLRISYSFFWISKRVMEKWEF